MGGINIKIIISAPKAPKNKKSAPKAPKNEKSAPKAPRNEKIGAEGAEIGRGGGYGGCLRWFVHL